MGAMWNSVLVPGAAPLVSGVGVVAHGWRGRRSARRHAAAMSSWSWFRLTKAGHLPDPEVFRSKAVAASSVRHHVLVLVRRQGDSIESFVATQSPVDAHFAESAASACAARVDASDVVPEVSARHVSCAVVDVDQAFAGSSSNLADPGELAAQMPSILADDGAWVAMVFRVPTKREQRAAERWYRSVEMAAPGARTHASLAKGGLMCSIWAGGPDEVSTSTMLQRIGAGLAGFDLSIRARADRSASVVVATNVVAAVAGVGAWMSGMGVWSAASMWSAGSMVSVGVSAGVVRSKLARAASMWSAGSVPLIAGRRRHPRARPASKNADGTVAREAKNPFPFTPALFPCGPQHPLMIVAPHTGAASGAGATLDREPPSSLTAPIGAFIGWSGANDRSVFVPMSDRYGGVMVFGEAGAGKSTLSHDLWAFDLLQRERPSLPGSVGSRNAMIAFESKDGRGALSWLHFVHHLGMANEAVVFDLNDPATPAIEMFAGGGTAYDRAAKFVDQMVYAWADEGTVKLEPALTALFALGLSVSPEIAAAGGCRPGSVLWYASVLAGAEADGDKGALRLFESIRDAAASAEVAAGGDPNDPFSPASVQRTSIAQTVTRSGAYFRGSATQRSNEFDSARRRIAALRACDAWFDPARPKLDWADLIDRHRIVVVNTGTPMRDGVVPLDARSTQRLSAMLMFGLMQAIQSRCSGWEQQGRAVSVFADELSIVAKASPDVVEWLREKGRSFGVRAAFATQSMYQLDPKVLAVVLGFSTTMWMQLGREAGFIEMARRQLDIDEPGVWTDQVSRIPKFYGILQTKVAGVKQPACMVSIARLEGMSIDEVRRLNAGGSDALR